jgi:hypothetical protein
VQEIPSRPVVPIHRHNRQRRRVNRNGAMGNARRATVRKGIVPRWSVSSRRIVRKESAPEGIAQFRNVQQEIVRKRIVRRETVRRVSSLRGKDPMEIARKVTEGPAAMGIVTVTIVGTVRRETARKGIAHTATVRRETARKGIAHTATVRRETVRKGIARTATVRRETVRKGIAHTAIARRETVRKGIAHTAIARRETVRKGIVHTATVRREIVRKGIVHTATVRRETARKGIAAPATSVLADLVVTVRKEIAADVRAAAIAAASAQPRFRHRLPI